MKTYCAGKKLRLTLALALALPCAAFGEKKLPEFRLNSTRISAIPRLADGDIPAVPPPTDTGYYAGSGGGRVRLDSLIKVVVDEERGRAEINFPAAEARRGFRSSLFVKFAANDSTSVLSWAAVVCSGGQYLGYKGSSLKLPDRAGEFAIRDESFALGPMKEMLGRTHPWILPAGEGGAFQPLDSVCSADFPKKMKGYSVRALPREANGFSFKYDQGRNVLTVTWSK
jgi:hypothetical protein